MRKFCTFLYSNILCRINIVLVIADVCVADNRGITEGIFVFAFCILSGLFAEGVSRNVSIFVFPKIPVHANGVPRTLFSIFFEQFGNYSTFGII